MFTKIIVATDGSSLAGKAVETAAKLAVKCGSELTILHVLMHGAAPAALKRLVEVEHLIKDHPHLQEALGNIGGLLPGQLDAAASDVKQHHLDHQIIEAFGERVVERAIINVRELGVPSPKRVILEGDTAHQIVAAANRLGADLIVLGSRGLGPLKGLVMGSVSQKVSEQAHCTCMFVK